MKTLLAFLLLATSPLLYATDTLPLDELGFVDTILLLNKDKIADLLGEPQEAIEVTDKRSGETIGLIWRYEYLNTNENGDYYKSTELDLVNGKVVNIIFSNSGIEGAETVAATITECAPSC